MKHNRKSFRKVRTATGIILSLSLILSSLTGCASTKSEEEEAHMAALDEAQERMEKIETEEQDFDSPSVEVQGKKKKKKQNRDSNGAPILLTVLPTISFSGRGVKVEFEDMLLTRLSLYADVEASSGYAAELSDNSAKAEFSIRLPVGRYECLLSEKAVDADRATVSVSIGEDNYDVYPSNPPLGIWELTTRVPIYIDVAEEKDFLVTISSAQAGMSLDYIQFVKIQ